MEKNEAIIKRELDSENQRKKTLREIYVLLSRTIKDITADSDTTLRHLSQRNKPHGSGKRVEKSLSFPPANTPTQSVYADKGTSMSPPTTPTCDESVFLERAPSEAERQNLDLLRMNVDYEQRLIEIKRKIERASTIREDDLEEFADIQRILESIVTSQRNAEKKLDKLCLGMDKVLKKQRGHAESYSDRNLTLPVELSDICKVIYRLKGSCFREFGKELGLSEDRIGNIEDQYDCDEERIKNVLLEWIATGHNISVSTLVKACSRLDATLIQGKPLSDTDAKVLESNMLFICNELMEVSLVIPHLISAGILTLQSVRYIIDEKVRQDRIIRLIDIIRTNEKGLDEFIKALETTGQKHIADKLQGKSIHLSESPDAEYMARGMRARSASDACLLDESECEDDTQSVFSEAAGKSSKPISTEVLLQQIVRLLNEAGFKVPHS